MVSYMANGTHWCLVLLVLILIVVDNGLVPLQHYNNYKIMISLNPYCSGQWSRTCSTLVWSSSCTSCLNPYCSGQWSRTYDAWYRWYYFIDVLILIVVDNGLVHVLELYLAAKDAAVLILIVVDNGLVRNFQVSLLWWLKGLNPYCSGQWSRTAAQLAHSKQLVCLNPYCSGQWSRTQLWLILQISRVS
mgnify:CR=1 FL=1